MGFHVWVLVSRFGLGRPGPPSPLDRPKFRSFFSLSRRKIVLFFPLWGSSRGNLLVFSKCWGRQMFTFGLSGLRGFTQQPENSKRAHLSAPALQTPPKFHEKTPREGKSAKFWASHPSGPHPSGPPTLHPTFRPHWVWAPGLHKKKKPIKNHKKKQLQKSKQLTEKIETKKKRHHVLCHAAGFLQRGLQPTNFGRISLSKNSHSLSPETSLHFVGIALHFVASLPPALRETLLDLGNTGPLNKITPRLTTWPLNGWWTWHAQRCTQKEWEMQTIPCGP